MKNRQSYTIKHAIQCLNTLVLRNFFSMPKGILQHISDPKDIRTLEIVDLIQLAQELREFIIDIVATKEGHLGASLGVVELTIALHYVFNTPKDKLIWDVGHQAYGHKILMTTLVPDIVQPPFRQSWEWPWPHK